MKDNKSFSRGFTLIELLVVISIISILSSIMLVSLTAAKTKAKETKISEEVKQIELALELYNNDHGGYPNPTNGDGGGLLFCIGNTNCLLAGEPISSEFPADIAQEHSNLAAAAALFGEYPNNEIITIDEKENRGYIYVACGGGLPYCNGTSYLLYPSYSGYKSLRIFEGYHEDACGISSCDNGNTCGNGHEACISFCNQDGACEPYDANGTGPCSVTCFTDSCGPNNDEPCTSYCPSPQSLNYDVDGIGNCNGTWFTSDDTVISYGYSHNDSGWAGTGYYGNSYPGSLSYYNGTGICINIGSISGIISGYSPGNYCSNQGEIIPDQIGYPWFTSDVNAASGGYSYYNNGWQGSGYYGVTYPNGYNNFNGVGNCISLTVSASATGYSSGSYCTSPYVTAPESSYPWYSSSAITEYSYFAEGWQGSGYYGTSVPNAYTHLNGTGSCVAMTVSAQLLGFGYTSGNYCETSNIDTASEGSLPWYTSDQLASGSYNYYGAGWANAGYYGNGAPSGYSNYNGTGTCINITVSTSYGGGNPSGNYCSSATNNTCACGNDTNTCSCNNDSNNCSCGITNSCSCGDPYTCSCGCVPDENGSCTDSYNCSCGDSYTCPCPDPNNCACGNSTLSCSCGNDTMNCPCN